MSEEQLLPLVEPKERKELLPRPLSHSAIQTYLRCPQKWKLKYVDKKEEKPRYFFSFGKTLHLALEFFYKAKALPPPSLEELLKAYYAHWISEGYASLKQEEQYRAEGVRILEEYYRKNAAAFKIPFFVEYEYRFHLRHDLKIRDAKGAEFELEIARHLRRFRVEAEYLQPVPIIGVVDRIDKTEDDRLDIVDYKTGKAFDLDRVREDPQLTMYQMACEEKLGLLVGKLILYHLPSQTPFSVERRGEAAVLALKDTIVAAAALIRRGMAKLKGAAESPEAEQLGLGLGKAAPAAERAPGAGGCEDAVPEEFKPYAEDTKCSWCDFKPFCPEWKHLFAKQAPCEQAPALESELQLAKLVDQYGRLKDEVHALEAKAEDVKKEIVGNLREKRYVRAFGEAYEVSLHDEEKWDFQDREKVLETVRRAGYWDKIVSPMVSLVQKLMNDPNLPIDLRERLSRLGHKTRHGALRVKKIEQED
ncbi:MAG: PD-(D/E)XK nuclease family protein [Elusimicrobia bacterium]|nr:PD-(D/E)XK nuclease family protein [Elusimicrobiota bacterium]